MKRASAEDIAFIELYNKFTKIHNNADACVGILSSIPIRNVSQQHRSYYACMLTKMTIHLPNQPANSPLTQHLVSAFDYHINNLSSSTIELLITSICDLDRSCPALSRHPELCTAVFASLGAAVARLVPPNGEVLTADRAADLFDSLLTSARVLLKLEIAMVTPAAPLQRTNRLLGALKQALDRTSPQRQCLNVMLLVLQVYSGEASNGQLVKWMRDLLTTHTTSEASAIAASPQLHTVLTALRMLHSLGEFARSATAETVHMLNFAYMAGKYLSALQALQPPLELKFDPCPICKSNALAHARIELGLSTARLCKALLRGKPDYADTTLVSFYRRITQTVAEAAAIRCARDKYLIDVSRRCVLDFPLDLQRLTATAQAWSYMEVLCTTLGADIFAHMPLERLMAVLLSLAPTDEDAIMVNYMHVSHLLHLQRQPDAVKPADWPLHESRLICALKRICALHTDRSDIYDIDARLESAAYTWHGLAVPQHAGGELLLRLLYCAIWHNAMARDKRDLLMLRILGTVPAARPVQALRVANAFCGYMLPEPVAEALRQRFEAAKAQQQQQQRNVEQLLHWYAAAANMTALEFLHAEAALTVRVQATLADAAQADQTDLRKPAHYAVFRRCVNLRQESGLLQRLQLAVRLYGKFVARARKLGDAAARANVELEVRNACEALPTLADKFQIRGYFAEAARAHRMVLELTETMGAAYAGLRLQSIAFVAWNRNCLVQRPLRPQRAGRNGAGDGGGDTAAAAAVNELDRVVEEFASVEMSAAFEQRDQLSRRRIALTLYALFGVVLFYADTGRMEECRQLLQLGQRLLVELEHKYAMGEANVHRMRYYAVQLKLITRYGQPSEVPPFVFAESMLRMCHNLQFEHGDGVNKFKCLLHEFLTEVSQYCLVRRDWAELPVVLNLFLKMAVRETLMLTCARILALWCAVELQQEKAEGGGHVLSLLDDCLGCLPEAEAAEKERCVAMEPIQRRVEQRTLSPVRDANPAAEMVPSHFRLERKNLLLNGPAAAPSNKYQLDHPSACNCHICAHPIFQQLLVEAAALYGLHYFIRSDYENAARSLRSAFDAFYKPPTASAFSSSDDDDPLLVSAVAQSNIHLCEYYAHSLWHAHKYDEATAMLHKALDWWPHDLNADEAVRTALNAQLRSIAALQANAAPSAVAVNRAPHVDNETVNEWIAGMTGTKITATSKTGPRLERPERVRLVEQQQQPTPKPPSAPAGTAPTKKRASAAKPAAAKSTAATSKPKFVVYVSSDSDIDEINASQECKKPLSNARHLANRRQPKGAKDTAAPAAAPAAAVAPARSTRARRAALGRQ